jgi:hypothetical protein
LRTARFRPIRAIGHVFFRVSFLLFLAYPAALADSGTAVSMSTAVEIALRNHPQLAGYPLEFQAAEGRALQASYAPIRVGGGRRKRPVGYPGTSRAETTA